MNTRDLTSLLLASTVLAAAPIASAQTTGQPGVDSDGDGVNDDIDAAPCDPRVALQRFDPADRTWGMFMFEDSWPEQGDFDFNDVVVAYNEVLDYDSAGLFTGLRLDVRVMAVGAHYHNGLAFHVPGVPASGVERLQLFVDGQPRAVTARSTETDLVVTLTDDLHGLMGALPGTWVNSDPNLPAAPFVDIVFIADFSPGRNVAATNAPFDLFLFNATRGTEVHLPQYRGTTAVDSGHFNTSDDGTTPSRAFVTNNGIPFALAFPEQVAYPVEGTSIASLYPTIVDFGQQLPGAENFFRTPVLAHAYGNVSPGAFRATTGADSSCFVSDPGRCGTAIDSGHVTAPAAGLCGYGAASAVSSSGGQFRWTCTGFYSTPTECTAPDLVCAPNATQGCAVANGSGTQMCNGSGTGWGGCTLSTCNSGYYASGNSCQPQVCSPSATRSCSVANGTGNETCNNLGSRWSGCAAVSCNSGYTLSGNSCLFSLASDADADGLSDAEEASLGTNPNRADTDGDGIGDSVEVAMGTNPRSASGRPGASGTAVSACRSLSSGSYYLTADINAGNVSECFTASRDVTLDCRGHAIRGSGAGNGISLPGHRYFFTLRNCEVSGFRAGLYASAHNYHLRIDDSSFHHNAEHGVQTQHHNYYTLIQDSRATFNGGNGFHLDDFAQGVDLRNNVASHNAGHGILIREYRSWSWSWSNPSVVVNPGTTFSICGNQVAGNASCEYNVYSGSGAGTPRLAPGCYEPAPSEPSCP